MAQNRHWTEVAETISLIASAGGAVVSVILEQVAYMAAPVTLALVLNLVNRQRLAASSTFQQREEIVHLQSSISGDLDSLRATVLGIAAHLDVREIKQAITTLELGMYNRLEQLESMDNQALQADINQLKNQSSYLLEALASILQRLNQPEESDRFQVLDSRLTQLTTEVNTLQTHLQNRLSPLEETIYTTSQNLAPIRESLAKLELQTQDSSPLQNLQPTPAEIYQKIDDFGGVFQKINTLETALTTVSDQVNQVQEELRTRLATLDLEAIQASAVQLESMRGTIAALGEQSNQLLTSFVQVTERLERLSLPSPGITSEQLETRFEQLTTYLAQVQSEVSEIKARTTQNQGLESQAINTELNQLKQQYHQIQTVLETLNHRLEQSPQSVENPVIEDRFTQLRTQYASLQNTLDRLINSPFKENPTPPPANSESTETREPETWLNRFIDRVRSATSIDTLEESNEEDFEDFEDEAEDPPLKTSPVTPLASPPRATDSPWQCIHSFTGNSSAVTALAIAPNNQMVVNGDRETLRFWDLATGQLIRTLTTQSGVSITSIALSPDGNTLACANGNIELWNLQTGQLENTLEPEDWTTIVVISPDGKTLASAGGDPIEQNSSIHLWDLATGEMIRTNYYVECEINALNFSPDGLLLAIAGGNPESQKGLIQVWNLGNGKTLLTLEPQTAIYSVGVSPDHQWILGGCSDQTIKLWNISTRGLVRSFSGHTGEVYAIALGTETSLLASASNDQSLKLWNWETGDLLATLSGHQAGVKALALSPNHQILASGSQDMTLKIWQNQFKV